MREDDLVEGDILVVRSFRNGVLVPLAAGSLGVRFFVYV